MDTEFLKNTFSKVIQDYDAARPRYPQELYEIVTGFAKIGAGATILEMLKPGGTLAVFWHMSSVTYYEGGIFDGLNTLKKKYLPLESLGFDAEGIQKVKERRIAQIQSGGRFGVPEINEYRWIDTYDAERYVTLLNTYSGTQTLPEEKRRQYLEEVREYINAHGGSVELPQHVMLYLVRKESR